MPIDTCKRQLAGRDPCKLPENHEGDCDHNNSTSTASPMAAAHLVEAKVNIQVTIARNARVNHSARDRW
jgi:hypothetical protein